MVLDTVDYVCKCLRMNPPLSFGIACMGRMLKGRVLLRPMLSLTACLIHEIEQKPVKRLSEEIIVRCECHPASLMRRTF